jgi:sialate O-acetylesterase
VGLLTDDRSTPEVVTGNTVISIAGQWLYQPGPDLSALPAPSKYSKLSEDPNTATLLFNGMIAPLTPYRIRGAIWYQGEANAIDKRSAQYRTLFPALILDWRKQWGYEFPFLFVQLAGWPPPPGEEPEESSFAELREAQNLTLAVPATGMASAVDQPDDHPKDKQTVGHRLALTAAKMVYGENVIDSGPIFKSMQIESRQIRIKFSNLGSGLLVKDKNGAIRGFEIAGADGRFRWAQARKDGQDIVVFNESVSQPVAVRYDWMNTPDGNLFNAEGLPAVPFRTDSPGASAVAH